MTCTGVAWDISGDATRCEIQGRDYGATTARYASAQHAVDIFENNMSKVIVVDDDYSTTSLMRMLLEMEGYAVATFVDTPSALAEAEQGVAAFIIDCYLGKDASGVDMLRAVRHHPDTKMRYTPVIMVSGDQRLAQTVMDEGADLFLLKPYSPSALTRKISELISTRA